MKRILSCLLVVAAPLCVWAQSTSGCMRGNCENGFGEYVYPSGDSYVGYWNEGVRYGGGTYNYQDGSLFVGSYANNMRHGKGTYTSAGGQKLSGRWARGKFVVERAEARSYVKPTLTKKIEVLKVSASDHKARVKPKLPLLQFNAAALAAEEVEPDERDTLEAEGLKLLMACTRYSIDDIKAFTYLYSLPGGQGVDDLYFRLETHNDKRVFPKTSTSKLLLKLKKYYSGVYEQGIDSGRDYWNDCDSVS